MDNQIQKKLFNYEAKPRNTIWNDIESALDDQQTETARKLYNYHQQPALKNWDKIIAALDNHKETSVIPFYKRYHQFIKKAGAVAAIAVLILSVTLLFNQKAANTNITEQIPAKNNNLNNNNNLQSTIQTNSVAQTNLNNIQVEKENSVFRNTYASAKNAFLKFKAQKLKQHVEKPYINASLLSGAKTSLVNANVLDKYMVITAEDGKAIKLPKKLYDKLSCADNYIDYEKACKEALATLQQKIATQISATDFTGLIDMLQNLQENQ